MVRYTGGEIISKYLIREGVKYVAGIPVMKVCLWFSVVEASFLPMNVLFATGRSWLYGRSVIAGMIVFVLATYLLLPVIGGLLAVAVGSLLGRAARTLAAYVDLIILTQQEKSIFRQYTRFRFSRGSGKNLFHCLYFGHVNHQCFYFSW